MRSFVGVYLRAGDNEIKKTMTMLRRIEWKKRIAKYAEILQRISVIAKCASIIRATKTKMVIRMNPEMGVGYAIIAHVN